MGFCQLFSGSWESTAAAIRIIFLEITASGLLGEDQPGSSPRFWAARSAVDSWLMTQKNSPRTSSGSSVSTAIQAMLRQFPQMQEPRWPSTKGTCSDQGRRQKSHQKSSGFMSRGSAPGRCMVRHGTSRGNSP